MSRVEQARTEIARRRALARRACQVEWSEDQAGMFGSSGLGHGSVGHTIAHGRADAEHAAANDPAHVLAVLDAADATLDRHHEVDRLLEGCDCDDPACTRGEPVRGPMCDVCGYDGQPVPPWPCPDAAAVLDLYAPAVKR